MKKRIKTFLDVVEYQLCCGCGLCAYMFPDDIKMRDVENFGLRPVIKDSFFKKSENSDKLDCCPGFNLRAPELHNIDGSTRYFSKAWGNIFGIWEGHATDTEVRYRSSSGGIATAIALYGIEHGLVSGILQVRANAENPILNESILSTTRESVLSAAGSRYSPAGPCEKLRLAKNAKHKVVVIGKPCDIAAATSAIKEEYDLKSKIFLKVACFCAGTPSTSGTLKMISRMGVNDVSNLKKLHYRGDGWPGEARIEVLEKSNLDRKSMTYDQSWGEILQKFRQWRCYICPDHTGEFADIALGDPWYRKPELGEKGRSLIVARTQLGKRIIEDMISGGYILANLADPIILSESQPNLLKAKSRLWGQLIALKISGVPTPNFKGFYLKDLWINELGFSEKLQSILGTLKRVKRKRLNKRVTY